MIVTETFCMNASRAFAADVEGCALTKAATKSASIGIFHDEVVRRRLSRVRQELEI